MNVEMEVIYLCAFLAPSFFLGAPESKHLAKTLHCQEYPTFLIRRTSTLPCPLHASLRTTECQGWPCTVVFVCNIED